MADGKYVTLTTLKQYGIGTTVDPLNTTVYNGAVAGTPDDAILSQCIYRAEMEFDRLAGTGYDQQTYAANVNAFLPFIDGAGWLHLFARERGPITAVSSVQIFDIVGGGPWQTITWTAVDGIIMPPFESGVNGYPHPDSWHVMINPSPAQPPRATGQILARWQYTGGFAPGSIPLGLQGTICRLAWWILKLREAPIYRIATTELGIMQVPIKIPPDIEQDIRLWQPVYA